MIEIAFITTICGYLAAELAFNYFTGMMVEPALWRFVFGGDDRP